MSTDRSRARHGCVTDDDAALDAALRLLGLDAPADETDLRRAERRTLLTAHPDHGGSLEAMTAVRAAAALVRRHRGSLPPATTAAPDVVSPARPGSAGRWITEAPRHTVLVDEPASARRTTPRTGRRSTSPSTFASILDAHLRRVG